MREVTYSAVLGLGAIGFALGVIGFAAVVVSDRPDPQRENTAMADETDNAQAEARRVGPPPGSRWRHFKGGTYEVVGTVVHETTLELMVHYRSEANGNHWVRPLSDFLGVHPGHGVRRFEQIG